MDSYDVGMCERKVLEGPVVGDVYRIVSDATRTEADDMWFCVPHSTSVRFKSMATPTTA